MKVAIINPFGNSSGHSLNYSSKLCNSLTKQDIELFLFTSTDYNPTTIIGDQDINYKIIRTEVKNNTLYNKDYKNISSLLKYGINLIKGNLKVLKKVKTNNRKEKFDIIHIIGGETLVSILFFFINSKHNSQLILTIHNSDFEKNLYSEISRLKELYKNLNKFVLKNLLFKRFSKIMVHGEQMKIDLVNQINFKDESKIFPINIGLDIKKNVESINAKSFPNVIRILFFGVIRKDKGLHILLEALKNITQNNFELLIYGKPAEYKDFEIESLVKSTGKSESVKLDLRYFDDNEIEGVFTNCDFVILPYLRTFKAQSVVLTLAAAHKKTLICSNTGQNGFDVQKYKIGYTFEAENTVELTRILQSIIKKDTLPIKDPTPFENYIKDNNWDKMGEKIFKMYLV